MTTNQTRAVYKALLTNNNNGKAGEISARILALVSTGTSLQVAFNAVLGANAWEAMIDELYNALQA